MEVRLRDKAVVLYDSLGDDPDNAAYGPSMIRYLHEVAHISGLTNQSLSQWGAMWTVATADNSPRQLNSYDCGVFTMTTGALLSQGCGINRQSYTQNDLYYYNVRQRLAFLLWDHGRVRRGHITRWLSTTSPPSHSSPPEHSTPPGASPTRASPSAHKRRRHCPADTPTPTTGQLPVSLDSPRRSPRKRRPPTQATTATATVTPSTSTIKRKRNPQDTLTDPSLQHGTSPEPTPKRSAKSLARQFSAAKGVPQCFFPNPRHKRKLYSIFDSCKRAKR